MKHQQFDSYYIYDCAYRHGGAYIINEKEKKLQKGKRKPKLYDTQVY
jgi:hypothetical protein